MSGEGRGLPVGWGWGELHSFLLTKGQGADLFSDADPEDERATAYTTGKWAVWAKGSPDLLAEGTATARPGETLLAAAQAAAEAALWRCDGYGTGEVRGLRLPLLTISDAAALVASRQTVTLPGLSGWWIVRAARCDGGAEGVEVDAVSAPSAGDRCPACGAVLPSTGIGCGSCRWMGEPLPGDAVRAPAAGDLCPACGAALPGDAVRAPSGQAVVAEWCCSLCKWHGATPERIALGRRCPSCHGEASLWIDYSFADEDAVRAPAEPIRIAVDAPGPLGLGVGEHDAPGGEAPCSCGAWHHATAAALSPAPVPFLPLGVEGITPEHEARLDAVIAACTGGEPRPGRSLWSVAAEMQGDPAPREPSAPADGAELARLLRHARAAIVLADASSSAGHVETTAKRIARALDQIDKAGRACELLLAERERVSATLQALFSDEATPTELATHTTELLEEAARETDKLRARVAELEAALASEREAHQACHAERVRYHDTAARLEAERAKTERRIAILTQTADAGEIAVGALERLRALAEEAERKLADVAALQTSTAADLDAARAQLRLVSAGPANVWRWQGDGHDDPASLACPVVMSAETLREFVAARERVAELEARLATPAADAIETTLADEQSLRNWLRIHGHGEALDAGRSGVEVAIGLLSAPPPHTAAALLARVEEARAEKAATGIAHDDREHRIYASGMAGGLYAAADLIRATLAPSPLDGVAAVHVACFAEDEFADIEHFATVAEGRAFASGYASGAGQYGAGSCAAYVLPAQEHEMKAVEKEEQWKLALAGMVACDAAKGGDK